HSNSVTDAGLAKLRKLPKLEHLDLAGNQGITDAGLKQLHGLQSLKSLRLRDTRVTADGVAALQKALTACQVEWDRDAAAGPDRGVAEWLFTIGGKISINGGPEIASTKDLPAGPFHISWINLYSNQQVKDDDLARLKGLTRITTLLLGGTRVTERGLAHVK